MQKQSKFLFILIMLVMAQVNSPADSRAHWPLWVDFTLPDSLQGQGHAVYLKLYQDFFILEDTSLSQELFVHFECGIDVNIGLPGYYMVEDSLFSENLNCDADTISGHLDFFQPAPEVVNPVDTTIYNFEWSELTASTINLMNGPVLHYDWQIFGSFNLNFPNPDSALVQLSPYRTGTYTMRVQARDSFGSIYPKEFKLTVIDQPEVNNRMNWNITFDGSPGHCQDVKLTLVENRVWKTGTELDLVCGQMDTTYLGRAEGLREIRLESQGYYQQMDTLCQLCNCNFMGLEQNPAQTMECNVNFIPGPVANAGPDDTLEVAGLGFLDASLSTPFSADRPLTHYEWECDMDLSSATCLFFDSANTELRLPFIPRDTGSLYFNLTVHDALGASTRDQVVYQVVPQGTLGLKDKSARRPDLLLKKNIISTSLGIRLTDKNITRLEIYNIHGQRLAGIPPEPSIHFDVSEYNSGLYFLIYQVDNFKRKAPFIILR